MNTHRDPCELAVDLLNRSSCLRQVSAVLSDRHGIFSWGWNHCRYPGRIGVHAEYHAILRSNRDRLKGAKLTIAGRNKKSGNSVLSFPCVQGKQYSRSSSQPCFELVLKYRIGELEFRTQSARWINAKLLYASSLSEFYCEKGRLIVCPAPFFNDPAFVRNLAETAPKCILIPIPGRCC